MLELLADAGPGVLPLWAVAVLAVGMYPLGFLFGVCSDCCCTNATCDGFVLEEAYSYRTGGQEVCDFTLSGNQIDFSEEDRPYRYWIQKGCRVIGDGVPSGTVVTDVSRIWEGDLELGPVMGCCRITTPSGTFPAITSEQYCQDLFDGNPQATDYSWTECESCAGGYRPEGPDGLGIAREVIENQTSNGLRVTLNNSITGSPDCLTFCGQSGLCGPFVQDEGYGPFGGGSAATRRNCVRWVCRCYEGTGKKDDPEFTDPADWCEVVSTTIVGGPTTNDLDLAAELEAATGGDAFDRVEWDVIFDNLGWQAADGDRFCAVFAFVFYGNSTQQQWDNCHYPYPKNLDLDITTPRVITSRDDYYTIHACTRCQ